MKPIIKLKGKLKIANLALNVNLNVYVLVTS